VVVLERDPVPRGSTALSAGLIPAAGTRFQRERGIADDSAALFATDIQRKAKERADSLTVATVTEEAARAVEWLADAHELPFGLVHDFDYPGHARRRMHGLPSRSGAELVDRLRAAAEVAGVTILTEARAEALVFDGERVRGARVLRPDGGAERVGARATILACCGYGGDPALVAEHLPAFAHAPYFGHPGNTGDALRWGVALGAALRDASGHQGHGNVAEPGGVLITWAVIMAGGVQVNARGERFWDESQGYSEAGEIVLAQAGGFAWCVFGARAAGIARQFEDFRNAEAAGLIAQADDVAALASRMRVDAAALRASLARATPDPFGRDWTGVPELAPPYRAVRVTGALFHTQGGLQVDARARVLREDGSAIASLFAAGGAARGVSGPDASGYLSGNGLLTAVALGRVAGSASASF
jgi:fumarate reductase flavoprotein subunit